MGTYVRLCGRRTDLDSVDVCLDAASLIMKSLAVRESREQPSRTGAVGLFGCRSSSLHRPRIGARVTAKHLLLASRFEDRHRARRLAGVERAVVTPAADP
jgi:hypothetical protein